MASMTFQFLDVGMGDSTFVIMGSGSSIQIALIDFGVQPFTKFKVGADDAMIYLRNTIAEISAGRTGKPLPYLDHLFITHPDQDHYNRLLDLINGPFPGYPGKKLSIGKLTYGAAKARYKGDLIDKIAVQVLDKKSIGDLADKAHAEVDGMDGSVESDWTFANGNVNVYLLSANYPSTGGYLPNPRSLCLMFKDQYGNKVILMGDAEKHVDKQIIENFKDAEDGFLNAFALKLGHHGAVAGTSQPWIDAVRPKAIFASGDFVWAHPYCTTINRVIASGSLAPFEEHYICCGKSGKEYFNEKQKLSVFLNLWYVVKKAKEKMTGADGTAMVDEGTTFGVQWQLEFTGAAKGKIVHTSTYVPV